MQSASPPLTKLAEIYSHPVGQIGSVNHAAIADYVPYKSGLTPITPNPNPPFPDLVNQRALEKYQTGRFQGFTAAELRALDSLAFEQPDFPDMRLEGLDVDHVFRRENWQNRRKAVHRALWPLGNGRPGFWHVDTYVGTQTIWDIILPSLRIATLVLNNAHTWPWWDAFLSNHIPLPVGKLPADKQHIPCQWYRLRAAQIVNSPAGRKGVQDYFRSLADDIIFDFACGSFDPDSTLPDPDDFHGLTCGPTPWWQKTTCNINFYLVEPLLNPKINSAERLLCQAELAVTILHEFCHALYTRSEESLDPYFEDEVLGEVGFSMEKAVFGGRTSQLNAAYINPKGLPFGGQMNFGWNNYASSINCLADQPILEPKPANYREATSYPVPISYFRNLHDPTFWQAYVPVWGSTSLHMGPFTAGSLFDFDTKQRRLIETPLLTDPVITLSMTDQEKATAKIQIDRNNSARTIRQDMQLNKDDRTFRDRQFLSQQPFPSPPPTPASQTPVYVEPRFEPQLTQYEFDLIFNYLVRYRDELALDTLHFEIPEHQLYWYILRSGFTGLEAWQWRGFLQECERSNKLFFWTEYFEPPTPTIGMVELNPLGWPPVPQKYNYNPQQPPPGTRLHAVFQDWYRSMHWLGDLEDPYSDSVFVQGQYDFDKEVCVFLVRKIMRENCLWTDPEITEVEFDECLGFCDSMLWMKGPKGIVRKSDRGWPPVVTSPSYSAPSTPSQSSSGSLSLSVTLERKL
ncbi:uncharacterized protein PAC_06179 [Phialocephala subalpina]|uniref:Uncharacterized protein n=1 Tax=Phialocephala subalpina TaxID=576137 RepID=A0A1L7WU46_9HELO|nr:uncharacterized protein PAC_06179 [Phialocephala subalpina]